MAVCPDCGTHLNGGWVQRTREVIELPVAPVEVTEHQGKPVCQRRRLPKEALQGVVLGQAPGGQSLNPAGGGTVAHKNQGGDASIRPEPSSRLHGVPVNSERRRQSRGAETGWRQWEQRLCLDQHSQRTILLRRGRDRVVKRCWIPPSAECWSVISTRLYPGRSNGAGLDLLGKKGAQRGSGGSPGLHGAKASVLPRAQPGHRTQLWWKLMVLAGLSLKIPWWFKERFIKELLDYRAEPREFDRQQDWPVVNSEQFLGK